MKKKAVKASTNDVTCYEKTVETPQHCKNCYAIVSRITALEDNQIILSRQIAAIEQLMPQTVSGKQKEDKKSKTGFSFWS